MTCAVRSVAPSPSIDDGPYVFSILIDPNKRTVLSIDSDDNSSWVTDRFSETTIAAHFASWNRSGTITLDRVTGVIEAMTEIRLSEKIIIIQDHGTCEESKRKF